MVDSRAVTFTEVWTPYPNPLYMNMRDGLGRIYNVMGGDIGRKCKHMHVRPGVLYEIGFSQASSVAVIGSIEEVYDPAEDADSEM